MNTTSRLTTMSATEKRALLARMLQDKARVAKTYPLSFAQERLWFLDQLQPGTPVYTVPTPIRLPGPLNVTALGRAVSELVRRHEALRTTFPVEQGKPVQRLGPAEPVPVPLADLRTMPESVRQAELQRLIAGEAVHVFDLARGPLIRALLIRVEEQDHTLVLTTHQIASDGWSTGILLQELGALYEAFAVGRPSPLPELPLQYADYAQQQREHLQGERLASLLGYWRQALEGAPRVLELPADRPRPAAQSFRGAWQSFTVGREVIDALKTLSRREGATLFMTLLAAFHALLYRYTGQTDLVVGTPIANRNRADIEKLIGFFANTLVIRTRLAGALTFRELLGQVRETTLGAYAHQDLPFEKLVEELHPERTLSHNPLFQVMFVLQNAPTQAAPAPLPAQAPAAPQATLSRFDLTLSFAEHAEGLSGTVEYSTDLFDHPTMTRMVGHLATLLADAAASPERRLSELVLLTEPERRQLLVEWNDTRTDYPAGACVHELIEAQVDRTPDAPAVVFQDRSLTYRELDERANRLAHQLRALGVGPEVKVGLCVERSLEMVVGTLAILKAGGVYLPLDPAHPGDRLRFMIEDAGAQVILTQARFASSLPAGGPQVLSLDADWGRIADQPGHRLATSTTPDSSLALFYTSGSTGKPKGSIGHVRGFVNLFHWYRTVASIDERSRVLVMTPFTFDASFKNLLTPLVAGGATVLADPELDVQKLLGTIERERVTTTFTTPSLLYPLLAEARGRDYAALASLEKLFVGGESTEVPRLRPWLASPACRCRVLHLYGRSECSDVSTIFVSPPGWIQEQSGMPIGRPIHNAKAYVLDASGNPLPIGVPGELCISGLIVGRGYLDRPVLTAQKFVPNPHNPGERLYRTGDRARWLASGDIELLGRLDHQVKIRGVRIEPSEVEGALAGRAGVARVVVLAREDSPGQKRLVAYVVPRPGASLTATELRRHAREKLPDYMVPSAFVVLDDLPLSPNGKVDRGALPTPEAARQGRPEERTAPRDAVEEVVASIWTELLGSGPIGVHESFFDLGGHSLLATQVASRLRDAFQIALPLRRLFEAPTVAELSASLASGAEERARLEKDARLLLQVAGMSDAEVDAMSRQQVQA